MHDTAHEHGRLFFELYVREDVRRVIELGSQDVNGSLRDHCPGGVCYIGLDVMVAKGVDLVVDPGACLPLGSDVADVVVTSSAFEHDCCFWSTFLELGRILRPGGLLYLNAPANGDFHRYPLDCWRFYPDAGVALVRWGARSGIELELLESFIGLPKAERWADFVAVFRKKGGARLPSRGRISEHVPAVNVYHAGLPDGAPLAAETESMPDATIATELREEVAAAKRENAALVSALAAERGVSESLSADLGAMLERNRSLSAELAAASDEAGELGRQMAASKQRISALESVLADLRAELTVMRNSTSWRVTAGLRRLGSLLRGE